MEIKAKHSILDPQTLLVWNAPALPLIFGIWSYVSIDSKCSKMIPQRPSNNNFKGIHTNLENMDGTRF